MKLRSELPHIGCICRDSSHWQVPLSERQSFEDAWTNGRPFWYGVDIYGASIIVKLADITGVIIKSADYLAVRDAERAEEKARALLEGSE